MARKPNESLHVHERIDPKRIIESVRKVDSGEWRVASGGWIVKAINISIHKPRSTYNWLYLRCTRNPCEKSLILFKPLDDSGIICPDEYENDLPILLTVYFPYRERYFKGGGTYEDKIFKGS